MNPSPSASDRVFNPPGCNVKQPQDHSFFVHSGVNVLAVEIAHTGDDEAAAGVLFSEPGEIK